MKRVFLLTLLICAFGWSQENYWFWPIGDYRCDKRLSFKNLKAQFYRFEIRGEDSLERQVKSPKSSREFYEYSAMDGQLLSKLWCHSVEWFGHVYPRIYDEKDSLIGTIKPQYEDGDVILYRFYDEQEKEFALAELNYEWNRLEIRSLGGSPLISCKKTIILDAKKYSILYFWNVTKHDNAEFDSRILWPFLSYIAETRWEPQKTIRWVENSAS